MGEPVKNKVLMVLAATTVLVGCGQKEIVREVLVTTPPTTAAPAPEANKFDQYLDMLYNESAQARDWAESDLLELGTTVCEVFDQGGTIDGVITIFSQNSSGKYDDDLFAAIIAGSVLFLCPEWADYVNAQLN